MTYTCNSNYLIETHGMTRRFGRRTVVNALDLQVAPGSVYGFLGPNGAGKTTTIRMLLGLIRPTAGQVCLFGKPLSGNRLNSLARVGALVENPSLYPNLTGWENLEVTRRLVNGTQTMINRALNIVELEKDANRLVKTYSMGMRQRLGIAIALLTSPDLLILDEPTNGLDPAGIHAIRELIRKLPQEYNMTVFLSSHLLGEVEQVATHLGIIDQGKLLFQGRIEELQARFAAVLSVGAEPKQDALRVIKENGWQAHANGDGRIYVNVNGPSDVAMLNAQLVYGGLKVAHLELQRPRLEDIFLELTAG